MMKYTDKYWKMLMPYIKKSINRCYGKAYTKELVQKTDLVYRDMLNHADDIGADNPMASNTYECLLFLAVWKASDGRISVDELREISVDVMSAPVLKMAGLFINGNKKSGMKRLRNMMLKNAAWLEKHPQYPLNNFAKKEGYLEVLPVMCDIDHLTAKLMHLKLNREQTLAGGGSMCDYWFVGDKVKNPQ